MSESPSEVPGLTETGSTIVHLRVVAAFFAAAWVLLLVFEAFAAGTSLQDALAGALALGVGLAATLVVTSLLRGTAHRGGLILSAFLVILATVVGLAVSVGALIHAPEFSGGPVEWIGKFLDRLVLVALGGGMLLGLIGTFVQATSVRQPLLNGRGRLLCIMGIGVTLVGTGATVALTRWATSLG